MESCAHHIHLALLMVDLRVTALCINIGIYTVDSGYKVHAFIALNSKEICAQQKVCTYKRAIYSGTAHWYRPLTSRCMDTIISHGSRESSLLVVRDSKS